MRLKDFLFERLKRKYTEQLIKMLPKDMHDCLRQVLQLGFETEPPYEYVLCCLNLCFEKLIRDTEPSCPPSMRDNGLLQKAYKYHNFEWNNTIGNRFRMSILQKNEGYLMKDFEDVWVGSHDS